jgi:hypothetical protein
MHIDIHTIYSQTVTQSHSHTVIQSYSHTVIQSYTHRHTVIHTQPYIYSPYTILLCVFKPLSCVHPGGYPPSSSCMQVRLCYTVCVISPLYYVILCYIPPILLYCYTVTYIPPILLLCVFKPLLCVFILLFVYTLILLYVYAPVAAHHLRHVCRYVHTLSNTYTNKN